MVDPIAVVAGAAQRLDRAKESRDLAIAHARAARVPLREIASAAGLSVSRIKQLSDVGPYTGGADLPAVTEVDSGAHGKAQDRVLALDDVDPWLQKWESEHAFLQADPARAESDRPDISSALYDLDPGVPWTAAYVTRTHEVYAFRRAPEGPPETTQMWEGSSSGPCVLLGKVPGYALVNVAINDPALVVRNRPGGLAWLHGRIQLINAIVRALADPVDGILDQGPEPLWQYLRTLEEDAR